MTSDNETTQRLKEANGWLTAMTVLCIIFLIFTFLLLVNDFKQKEEIENLKLQIQNHDQRQLESGPLDQ